MSEIAERAIEIIGKRSVRSPALADALDCTVENVHELLRPEVERGRLVACAVESAGHGSIMEYRLSLAGGGRQTGWNPLAASRDPALKTPPRLPPAAASHTAPKEEPVEKQSTASKILAALKEHGPMTTAQLGEHVHTEHLGTYLSQMTKAGRLRKEGGRGGVYRVAGAAERAARKPARKASGGGSAAVRRKRRLKRTSRIPTPAFDAVLRESGLKPASKKPSVMFTFRPAIAADGALLLLGATQTGELNAAETRVLVEFLRRVDRTGARA